MAVAILGAVFRLDLSPSQKLVLLALADCADSAGTCFPGRRLLSEKTGLTDRTVDKCIKALADAGLLKVERRLTDRGDHTSNLYQIFLPEEGGGVAKKFRHVAKEFRQVPPSISPPCLTVNESSKKKPSASLSDHAWFTRWWCHSFQTLTGSPYAYSKKSAGGIKRLLDSLGLEELVARSCAYLTLPAGRRFPQGAPTLEGLAAMVNQLAGRCNPETEEECSRLGILPDDFETPLLSFTPWESAA